MRSRFFKRSANRFRRNKIVLLTLLIGMSLASFSQVEIISENFSDGTKPTGWVDEGLVVNWNFAATGSFDPYQPEPSSPHSSPYCACIGHNYYGSAYTQKLITPKMDLTNFKNVKVNFWHAQAQPYSYYLLSTMSLYYKTATNSSHWNKINEYTSPLSSWTQVIENIPDDSLTNEMYVAFEVQVQSDHGCQLDDIKITGEPLSGFDAKMISLVNPITWAAGSANTITVVAGNWAADSIISATYGYQLDNNTKVTEAANFDTLWSGEFDTFSFSTKLYPSEGTHIFKFWINNANGGTDDDASNDTIILNFRTALSDTFYIGSSSSADYLSIQDACDDLELYGVSGPTVFMIEPGTYNESVEINSILGASATNTIVFDGSSKSSVSIVDNNESSVWTFLKADYITLKNLTIINSYSNSGYGIQLFRKCSYNKFLNLEIQINSTSYNSVGIVATSQLDNTNGPGDGADNTLIQNVKISGGAASIKLNGGKISSNSLGDYADPYCFNNNIIDCELLDFTDYGIYMSGQSGQTIQGNYIFSSNSYAYAINHQYSKDLEIKNNELYARYGIYEYSTNSIGDSAVIINNLSTGDLYLYYSNSIHALNNTFRGQYRTLYVRYSNDIYLYNNIFDGTSTSYTAYIYDCSHFVSEYNNFYSNNFRVYVRGFSTYYTLEDWQDDDPTINQNAWNEDPHFISAYDLHLDNSYKPITGTNEFNILTDFDGDARCLYGPSIGADEVNYNWQAPNVDFLTEDTLCQNIEVVFQNSALDGEPSNHKWYLNESLMSTDKDWIYTFTTVGNDTVKLVTYSCGGIDSATKVVVVDTPKVISQPEFLADKYVIEAGEMVNFFDLSTECPSEWAWSISPREVFDPYMGVNVPSVFYDDCDSTVKNPSVVFSYTGSYDVCLYVGNGLGVDSICKEDYIIVKASYNMCNYTTPDITQSPYGIISDDGGMFDEYDNGLNCEVLLEPCASEITLKFKDFDVSSGDYLKIYDDRGGNPLWNINQYPNGLGNNLGLFDLKSDTSITSYTGKLYIVWETDGSSVSDGFIAEWSSVPDTTARPTASFTAQDTACVGETIHFDATASGSNLYYSWDLDGDNVADQFQEDLDFQYSVPGTYTVTLEVTSLCNPVKEIVSKQIVIVQPVSAPGIKFRTDNTIPIVNESRVTLEDLSIGCANSWEWQISPSSFSVVSGYPYSPSSVVVFNDTGCFDVTLIVGYNGLFDTLTKTCFIKPIKYCDPIVQNTNTDVGISRVKFSNIDSRTSVGEEAYSNFITSNIANLELNANYNIVIERITGSNSINRKVWIDWNLDGDFNDSLELVVDENNSSTIVYRGMVEVPLFAKTGYGVMRVATSLGNNSLKPCSTILYGEVEDYGIKISPDRTEPIITLIGKDYIETSQCGQYIDSGATATDNIDGDITSKIITTNDLNLSLPGTYYYSYNVKDSNGNHAEEVLRTIVVLPDTTGPVIQLLGKTIDSVEVYSTYNDPGFYATKRCASITGTSVTSTVDTSVVGNYTIVYEGTDSLGNTVSVTRKVIVVDTKNPVLTLLGNIVDSTAVFMPYNDPGVSVSDNYYQNLTIDVDGDVNHNIVGDYFIEYSVTDPSGNGPVKVVRTVKVIDTVKPVLTSMIYSNNDTLNLEVNSKFKSPKIGISDNYYQNLKGIDKGTYFKRFVNGVATDLGTYSYFLEVTDGSGNTASFSIIIIVEDTEEPVIRLNGPDYTKICRFEELGYGVVVEDNFDKNLKETIGGTYVTDYLTSYAPGYYTLYFDAADNSGNQANRVYMGVDVLDTDEGPCFTDFEENKVFESVNIYPNPSNGLVNISVDLKSRSDLNIEVTNSIGQIVYQTIEYNITSEVIQLNLNDKAKGIYFIKISNSEENTVLPLYISN